MSTTRPGFPAAFSPSLCIISLASLLSLSQDHAGDKASRPRLWTRSRVLPRFPAVVAPNPLPPRSSASGARAAAAAPPWTPSRRLPPHRPSARVVHAVAHRSTSPTPVLVRSTLTPPASSASNNVLRSSAGTNGSSSSLASVLLDLFCIGSKPLIHSLIAGGRRHALYLASPAVVPCFMNETASATPSLTRSSASRPSSPTELAQVPCFDFALELRGFVRLHPFVFFMDSFFFLAGSQSR
ncbi:uncharacterized protein LOC125517664 [Triticum urartu]|uniref:uncharacterized protein LOC125517664 n=1 Tax=Triticum urartu TaxID=4572 RepID=UPI002042E0CF|nr:uncharacterized protein LOC125517664 [Triticum urartu]